MFDIIGQDSIIKDLHKIVSNRVVLLNDGENDILYTGLNPYQNRILGSIMCESDDQSYLRYLHVMVTDRQYTDFINRRLTLRNLLETNQALFIVDLSHNDEELSSKLSKFADIPDEYKPLQNSFCPPFVYDPSFAYSISMKGNLADMHKALPEDVNNANTTLSRFIQTATEFLPDIGVDRLVLIEPAEVGSFKLRFKLELLTSKQLNVFPVSLNDISGYLNEFFRYVLDKLPHEKQNALRKETINSEDFKHLEESLTKLFISRATIPIAGMEQKLIDSITYSVQNLKPLEFAQSFNRLEFANVNTNGEEVPMAIIDKDYITSVEDKFFKEEGLPLLEEKVEYDDFPKEYKIQVYWFNVETGNGGAQLFVGEDRLEKVGLHARGKKSYQHTPLAKSLGDTIAVKVNGIAKRVNGKYQEIVITY